MTDDDYMPDERDLLRLSFQLAGRLPDHGRAFAGRMAAGAQWDLLVEDLAAAVVHRGVPVTAEELAIINDGLRWLGEQAPIDPAVAVGDAEVEEHLRRWRFEPAQASGEPYEQATTSLLEESLPEATALLSAWRTAPDGGRARAWCVDCTAEPDQVWGRVYSRWLEVLGGKLPDQEGIVLEAVQDGRPWSPYHQALLDAAEPVWRRVPAG